MYPFGSMDVEVTINKLRARFLKQSSEKDQLNRIIKPYGEINDTVLQLYKGDDGSNLLQSLDSPPIAGSYIKQSRATGNYISGTGSKLFSNSQNNTMVSLVEEEEEGLGLRPNPSIMKVPSVKKNNSSPDISEKSRSRTQSIIADTSSLKNKMVHSLHRRGSDLSLQRSTSRASEKLKTVKKSGLRLSRLFRSSSNASKDSKGSGAGKAIFISGRSRAGSLKKPALNLYDHFLYTHEGLNNLEDDDDDDDDKYEYDKGAVVNFFGKEKRNNNSSSSLTLDEKAKSAKRNTFLENFPLNPHNILQSSDTVGSNDSGEKRNKVNKVQNKKNKQNENTALTAAAAAAAENDTTSSYIESYLNQPDLKPFDQPNEISTSSPSKLRGISSHLNDRVSVSNFNSPNLLIDGGDESNGIHDDVSSYGESLLDSDFSGDDFESSQVPSSELSSMTFDSHDIPSNSIPQSRTMAMYHSADESKLDNELDKATKLLHMANRAHREVLSQSVPKDAATNSSKRTLSSSQSEQRANGSTHHRNSASTTFSNRSRHLKPINGHRRTSSNLTETSIDEDDEVDDSKQEEPELVIEKVDVPSSKNKSESALSAMFNKDKVTQMNPLEYFSGVSAVKELPRNSLKLDVYIQDSKAYKRKPFTIAVKKSATVFEVLGYSLYCYSTEFKPPDSTGELSPDEIVNPNYFTLKIVDEDGEPFEDNFGVLERTQKIDTVFDNEVVICHVTNDEQFKMNEKETPLPAVMKDTGVVQEQPDNSPHINQLSYYKSILPANSLQPSNTGSNIVTIKVFLYPNLNPQFNFTNIKVPVSSKINEILVSYCKLKNLDPSDYVLKLENRDLILDLNDYITSLDGNYKLEVLKKRDARTKKFDRMKATNQPVLQTIQSTELTPLTLTMANDNRFMQKNREDEEAKEAVKEETGEGKTTSTTKSLFNMSKHNHTSSASGFFKLKNTSKTSLKSGKLGVTSKRSSSISGNTSYKDLFTGSYYKYKVWRRQQMSFINKHERTLVIDGDYVYISGPDGDLNWTHENVKTKSFHVSQITLVKRSKRVPEYFKIFVHRPDRERRYYFEAVSAEECVEIITRLQNLIRVYRMNQR